ncbi:PD-(D/E)XK nuclease family protein [Anabaena sphaerica FACHB-251]|uniref:PD-(D/E)XK nuclease family protein n=1 Tax=Anabaena sphaerica FACHB-251 TaxID=2692883 RepID=A0A926WGY9_9NOST|nr:PD-(D/E)XK nuclease family protein [Anabaena sphaerica]MBD2293935.1 PD-(D/E)XK nuclease family protein [Anabaena sphaerica FACHB-251]
MLSTSTQLFRLSQGHLNLLAACPRKFQHTYLEQLTAPTDPQQEEYQTLGSRFHLLMQQQEMGLPINSFLQADTQLQTWMTDFANVAPEILTPDNDSQTFRDSEHYRTLQIQDYLLTVIYDLLIADQEKAQIFDWKTYPQPPNKSYLAKNWQTRLYMYVLAETSEYLPNNISMNYWFVQAKDQPKNLQFKYDTRKHKQTEHDLNELLSNLTNWLEQYHQKGPFPQEPASKKSCEYCQYAVLCYSQTNNPVEISSQILPNIDNIQEVSL